MIRPLLVSRPVTGVAGAERVFEHLALGLTGLGVDVHAAVVGPATPAIGDLVARFRAVGATTAHLRGRAWPWELRRLADRTRADVLHWNMPSPFAFGGAAWLAVPWGRPSITHDHLPMIHVGGRWGATRRLANRRLAALVVSSDDALAAARDQWDHLPPVHVVPNAVLPVTPEVRAWSAGQPLRLVSVGRLEEQKNPELLVDVLAGLRRDGVDASLRFLGAGSLTDAVRRRAGSGGVADAVELPGWSDDVADELRRAHLYLTAARYEGLPLAPLEALASGLPVIASAIGPHEEIARRGGGIELVAGEDVGAWVAAIRRTAAQLGDASRAAASTSGAFTPGALASGVLEVYESVRR